MNRISVFVVLSSILVGGCDKLKSEDSPEKQYEAVMRLAQAPEATEAFLSQYSSITCKAKTKNLCTPKGCELGPVTVTQSYDVGARIYRRNDNKGGDQYPANFSPSGVWFNFAFPQNAMLFRVNTLGDFTEVVALNDLTIVYSGSCQFK